MTDAPIEGFVAPGFEPVRAAFVANFERRPAHREVGASLAVYRHGECVVDLWGGYADKAHSRRWERDTLVNLWSTTKGVAAMCVALLVERGQLRYQDRVADHWPEFAAAGKSDVTVAQVLSHEAGLPGFATPIELDDLYDQAKCAALLAAQAPLWEPGTANGYHATTFGVLVAEIVRRVDGCTLGRMLGDELAGPRDVDLLIGLPTERSSNVAELIPPDSPVDLSAMELTSAMALALGSPQMDPHRANDPTWRAAELPALNGHGSAQGIAKLYAASLARSGPNAFLSEGTFRAMTSPGADRTDLVLGFAPEWGMGVLTNGARLLGPEPDTFGHGGWGGSLGCASADRGIAIGYALNHMGPELVGDPRTTALCHTVFECAG